MAEKFRKMGIDFMGDLPWGTHFCQFYQGKEDLIGILVPYFRAGLENNEFCMWVCSEPLKAKDAKAALKKAVKNLDDYIKNGQIEILNASDWYTKSGEFEAERVLQGWVEKESQAIKRGFEGLRLTGNTFWLEKQDWRSFNEYERVVNDVITKYRMLVLCTYSLDKCGPAEVIDVIGAHQFALIRRESKWELMENAEHRRTEEILRESEEKFRLLAENTQDIICLHTPDRRYIYVNPPCKKILGYEPDELIGKDPFEFVHPEDRERVEKESYPGAVGGENIVVSYRIRRKSGEYIWLESTNQALKDEKGNITQVVSVSRDITERKKAEETLLQAERLRALGEMAAGVAHDFNNLLAIILGNAQLLEKGLRRYKEQEIRDRLKIIARTASEGGETVSRLQYFTQRGISTEDFTQIDLNEIVRETISSTSPRWKDEAEAKGITIKIKENLGKLPPLLGSRSELMEVLTNLIFNAIETMRKGGEITIKTKAQENKVFLYFTDIGEGIPKGIEDKIFEPFFTTKGSKASGLGLSTCYGIIQRHKGDIKVESTEGKGTTFTISIPIPLEVPQHKEKLEDLEKVPSRKILVIDDEEGVRDVLGGILKSEGYRVTLAETGRKGLKEFKKSHFDLVFTHLGMPEMSGWELAQRIKEINPDTPVGMITGWGVTFTKEKLKEEGVDFTLSQPFDYAKVVREVNALLKSKER